MRVRRICALIAVLAAACRPAPHDDLALRVEYAGCRMDANDLPCAPVAGRRLTLWVEAPDAAIEIDPEGLIAPPPAPVEVQGGRRYALELAPDAHAVRVHARTRSASRTWQLELADSGADPLAPARAQLDAQEVDAARTTLEQLVESGPESARGAALGLLARIALRGSHREEAQAHLRAAIAAHETHGERAGLVNDATMLAFLLLQQRRYAEARSVLDALEPASDASAQSRVRIDYYQGVLALETGDARAALRRYQAAMAQAERIDAATWARAAEDDLATQLQALGRRSEADALYAQLVREMPADAGACEHARLLTNAAWNRLLALEAGEPAEDPTPLLEQVRGLYANGCDAQVDSQANVRLNLALAALQAGRTDDAQAQLEAAEPLRAQASAGLSLWWRDLDARVALAQSRPQDALHAYEELDALASAGAAPEAQWRAALGQAQSLVALGDRAAALAAYARAEQLLDQESLQVPMQEGRETFAARRERATREHVAQLLIADRADEALGVVRRARSRTLRALYRQDRLAQLAGPERARWDAAVAEYLAQRDALNDAAAQDWHLSADALRAVEAQRATTRAALARALDDAFAVLDRDATGTQQLQETAPGELMLAYHPLPAGWAAFAHTRNGTRAVTLECVDGADGSQALSSCVLEPFRREIEQAQQVRVLPYGVLRNVDFHALPFGGDVLLAVAPVVYGLDLPALPDAAARMDRALVVADPRGNLPAARHEAALVSAALEAGREWRSETLAGQAARASALRTRLGEVDLFHYAGHAVFGGESGWDSVLPLAESSDLTLGDILALTHAPRWVVLSGCETARTGTATPAESLGLAQAFLAAGSSSVLAAVRPVADETAASLVDGFYRAWTQTTPASAALRAAQLALRASDPGADWASFRIVEH